MQPQTQQLTLNAQLEVSESVLRAALTRAVAHLDVPLELPGPLPIKLGRLHEGTVSAFRLGQGEIRLELRFAHGLGVTLELAELSFEPSEQRLTCRVDRLAAQGFVGAGVVNGVRAALLAGLVRGANRSVPGLLEVQGLRLSVHLAPLIERALSDPDLRARLMAALPVPGAPSLRLLGLEVRPSRLWLEIAAGV